MNATTATLRPYRVSLVTSRGLIDYGTAQATDAADAVRVAHDLSRRPSLRHDGPNGSGYVVRGRTFVASPVACPVCGAAHELIASDSAPDDDGPVTAEEAQGTAHYRLEVIARSARPFVLHGGRAA